MSQRIFPNTLILLVAVLAISTSNGCKGGESRVIGKWKATEMSNGGKTEPIPAEAKNLPSSFSLELKSDHTFALDIIMKLEGKWALEGDTLSLTPEKVAGLPGMNSEDKKAFKATINSDGKKLVVTSPEGNAGTVTFERQ